MRKIIPITIKIRPDFVFLEREISATPILPLSANEAKKTPVIIKAMVKIREAGAYKTIKVQR